MEELGSAVVKALRWAAVGLEALTAWYDLRTTGGAPKVSRKRGRWGAVGSPSARRGAA
jgi:hypothetical protein